MSENTTPEPEPSKQEKLRRERELLLTSFDPSEFGVPSDSGSFAALAEHVNRAEPTDDSSAGPVRPDEEATT